MNINEVIPGKTLVKQSDTNRPSLKSDVNFPNPGEYGTVVHIFINNLHYSTTYDINGNWSWTAPEDIPDGIYNAVLYNVDQAGTPSDDVTLLDFIIDTTPPEAPDLLNLFDDVGGKTGSFDKGGTTDDSRPTLTGLSQPGTTVYLLDDKGNKLGSAVADKVTGKWTMEPDQPLQEGANTLRLRADEKFAGKLREGVVSDEFVINVDGGATPPLHVDITGAVDNAGVAKGALEYGAITDDQTPTLQGTVTAGESVTLYYRAAGSTGAWTTGGVATVTGESWSWEPGSNLPAGKYEFQARSGNVNSAQFVLELVPESQMSGKTVIVDAWDDVGTTGVLSTGDITDDYRPELRGRAEANSMVYLVAKHALHGSQTFTIQADHTGNWSWTPDNDLTVGSWEFKVKKNASGNLSSAFNLILEAPNAAAPKILSAEDDTDPNNLVSLSRGDTTDDLTPTLFGTGTANTTVTIRSTLNGKNTNFNVNVDEDGYWSWTPPKDMEQGDWTFKVKKEGGTKWESAFDLTLKNGSSGGDYSGIIDFEEYNNTDNRIKYDAQYEAQRHANTRVNFIFYSGSTNPSYVEFISPDNKKYPELGNSSVRLPKTNNGSFFELNSFDDNSNFVSEIKEFNLTIINPLSKEMEIFIRIVAGKDIYKQFQFTLHPGANSFSQAYIHEKLIPEGTATGSIRIYNSTESDIFLDNITWSLDTNYHPAPLHISEDNDATHTLSAIDDLTSSAIIGNEGQTDTLYLTGHDQLLDLSAHSAEIQSVEVFDINGDGDNTLVVDINSLLHYGEKDLFIEDGKTQLLVRGDEGDTVQLKDILPEGSDVSEWVHQDGTVTVAGVEYQVYSHGDDAELLIQQGVKTELV